MLCWLVGGLVCWYWVCMCSSAGVMCHRLSTCTARLIVVLSICCMEYKLHVHAVKCGGNPWPVELTALLLDLFAVEY